MLRTVLGAVLISAVLSCAAHAQQPQAQSAAPAPHSAVQTPQPAAAPPAAAQQAQTAAQNTDSQAVINAMVQAMGGKDIQSIRVSGSGFTFAFGESYSPDDAWPRFRLERYQELVNYSQLSSREVLVSTQAESPARGGGNQPIIGAREQVLAFSGDDAWNQTAALPAIPAAGASLLPLAGATPEPAPRAVDERRIFIWLTPQGFVKAALTHPAAVQTQMVRRQPVTSISFTLDDGIQVQGVLNESHLVSRVTTRIPNPVLGDMLVEISYLNYHDIGGGVQFPSQILVQKGGFHTLELTVSKAAVNPADSSIEVPAEARAQKAELQLIAQKVSTGLWFLSGAEHNSVVVEFRDFVAVIEAPEDEQSAVAVIDKVKELVPNKPIRYLINTHHHFDHAGGLRTFAAEGATIVTHVSNREFYGIIFSADHNLRPDRLAQSDLNPRLELVGDYGEIENGSRVLEIHHVAGNQHDAGLLMVYLPHEKLLVEADAFTPVPEGTAEPSTPNSFAVNLYDNVTRLQLDVAQIAPIEGRLVPWSELLKAIGQPSEDNPDNGLVRASMSERHLPL